MKPLTALTLLLLAPSLPALAQTQTHAVHHEERSLEVGLGYTYLRANILPGCNCISLNGGSAEAQYRFSRRFAAVADFTAVHRGGITPDNYGLTQVTYTFGIRAFPIRPEARFKPFAEVLLGRAQVSGTLAPVNAGTGTSNGSFALQAGGGLLYQVSRRFTLRPVQADFMRTTLSNNADDRQHDLRLTTGLNFRLGH